MTNWRDDPPEEKPRRRRSRGDDWGPPRSGRREGRDRGKGGGASGPGALLLTALLVAAGLLLLAGLAARALLRPVTAEAADYAELVGALSRGESGDDEAGARALPQELRRARRELKRLRQELAAAQQRQALALEDGKAVRNTLGVMENEAARLREQLAFYKGMAKPEGARAGVRVQDLRIRRADAPGGGASGQAVGSGDELLPGAVAPAATAAQRTASSLEARDALGADAALAAAARAAKGSAAPAGRKGEAPLIRTVLPDALPAPAAKPAPGAAAPATAANSAGPQRLHYELVLMQSTRAEERIAGTAELAIEGVRNGVTFTLPVKGMVTAGDRELVFSFKYYDEFAGDFTLPAGFVPGKVIVTLKAVNDRPVATDEFPWAVVAGSLAGSAPVSAE